MSSHEEIDSAETLPYRISDAGVCIGELEYQQTYLLRGCGQSRIAVYNGQTGGCYCFRIYDNDGMYCGSLTCDACSLMDYIISEIEVNDGFLKDAPGANAHVIPPSPEYIFSKGPFGLAERVEWLWQQNHSQPLDSGRPPPS